MSMWKCEILGPLGRPTDEQPDTERLKPEIHLQILALRYSKDVPEQLARRCKLQKGSLKGSPIHPMSHEKGGSLGSPGKRKEKASSNKDCMFNTLTLLKMDLVKFVSSVQNLKLAMATDSNFNLPNVEVEVPMDAHNNITVYELSGNKDSD
ncbi:hypothetical protein MJG53_020160 [Ovis ammon polii x Ovis aries]|uniref:Uncharacterized protein n=2 Tax=Ovis TaxID=9935 RepID=A0AAD4YF47_OVIAM|nr:hypothetical protein MG293_005213 [Ovis ammon polii]KAI4554861.1 hypothetical protein MJG53_020160 [Ovis ammon polii x Ovis aries]